jgi:hypothetical protein
MPTNMAVLMSPASQIESSALCHGFLAILRQPRRLLTASDENGSGCRLKKERKS